jgi:hypothetical protein
VDTAYGVVIYIYPLLKKVEQKHLNLLLKKVEQKQFKKIIIK